MEKYPTYNLKNHKKTETLTNVDEYETTKLISRKITPKKDKMNLWN